MGDRCYLQMWLAVKDQQRAYDLVGVDTEFDDELPDEHGLIRMMHDEANYGYSEERKTLAEEGVLFYGDHGSGCNYPPYCFASWNKQLWECEADDEGFPIVRINADGSVNEGQKRSAMLYYQALRQCKEALGIKEEVAT